MNKPLTKKVGACAELPPVDGWMTSGKATGSNITLALNG
tara:strand:+ start:478 stop:594 length:117 start_codon:yes stop_codon:yes gene_type:complete